MAVENFRKEERRYFIGRINRDKERETLRMENFNSLPTALRDRFDVGRGFDTAQTANQGVNFFNSAEAEKGENRRYWYFRIDITNIELVPINNNTDDFIKEYFNDLQNDEVVEDEAVEDNTEGTEE